WPYAFPALIPAGVTDTLTKGDTPSSRILHTPQKSIETRSGVFAFINLDQIVFKQAIDFRIVPISSIRTLSASLSSAVGRRGPGCGKDRYFPLYRLMCRRIGAAQGAHRRKYRPPS